LQNLQVKAGLTQPDSGQDRPHPSDRDRVAQELRERVRQQQARGERLLTVYFGTPSMFITLWFEFDYGTNPLLGTLII
jgi:hypothetical protein